MSKVKNKNRSLIWFLSFVTVIFGFGIYFYAVKNQIDKNNEVGLGTCATPEEAYVETQKALDLLSLHLNSGMKNVQSLQEYQKVKEKVFKEKK